MHKTDKKPKQEFMENTTLEFKLLGTNYRYTNRRDKTEHYQNTGWSTSYMNANPRRPRQEGGSVSHSVVHEVWKKSFIPGLYYKID